MWLTGPFWQLECGRVVLQAVQEPDYDWVLVDGTTRKAHKAAASQKKVPLRLKRWPQWGGFGTKVDALGNCLHCALPPAKCADSRHLPAALDQPPGAVVCDKAYDTNAVLQILVDQAAEAVISPKASRLAQRPYDNNLDVDRHKIERFLGRRKEARGFCNTLRKNG